MSWSPCAEFGNGGAIPASCLSGPFLVSRFCCVPYCPANSQSVRVRLVQIHDRELHGKFFLWDDDDLVITSLNWSSADTRSDAPQGEIGLYIKSPNIAANPRQRLIEGWPALDAAADTPHEASARTRRRRGRK
jgi:cardiolipin synthase A/B